MTPRKASLPIRAELLLGLAVLLAAGEARSMLHGEAGSGCGLPLAVNTCTVHARTRPATPGPEKARRPEIVKSSVCCAAGK